MANVYSGVEEKKAGALEDIYNVMGQWDTG